MAFGILRVLLFCGISLLVLLPIPTGFLAVYLARADYHLDWSWSALAGVLMAGAIALLGLIFRLFGGIIVKHRVKRLGYHDIENDA